MKKILTISTDHQLLELMESQISSLGFELDTIESGEDLLNKINAGRPDVLVVDFILGDENAAAVCHQISSGPDTHGLPIIILSDMPGIEHIAEKAGGFAVIKKPMAMEALAENLIAALMQHAHAQ